MSDFEKNYQHKGDRDEDEAYDDSVVAYLLIKVRRNGSMSTEGCIDDELYSMAMLDNAKDAVRAHNARKVKGVKEKIITPAYDTPLAG